MESIFFLAKSVAVWEIECINMKARDKLLVQSLNKLQSSL